MARITIVMVLAGAVGVSACKSSGSSTAPPEDSHLLSVVSGDGQSVVVGTQAAEPLVVQVTDLAGAPAAGVTVAFTPGIGGSFSTPPATDADGRTMTTFTASTRAGVDSIRATVASSTSKAIFVLTILPGPPAGLRKLAGDGQVAPPGATLTYPFVVDVKDADGNNLEGIEVTWTTNGGALSAASTTTDDGGRTQTVLTLPSAAGTYRITAHVPGITDVTFTAFAR